MLRWIIVVTVVMQAALIVELFVYFALHGNVVIGRLMDDVFFAELCVVILGALALVVALVLEEFRD